MARTKTPEQPTESTPPEGQGQPAEPTPPEQPARRSTERDQDPQSEVLAAIREMSNSIIGQAELLRNQINNSEIQRGLAELRQSTQLFRALAESAIVGSLAPPSGERIATIPGTPAPQPNKEPPCGCRQGCGSEHKPSCCIQLYIAKVRVVQGQNAADKNQLELIIAVQAMESWGLVPGLSGNLGVNAKSGWVAVYGPIAKFCVPCNECITVPLFAEAMEVETNALGGRPEFGSNTSAMTLRCDCPIAPVHIVVELSGGGVGKGVIEIEVGAKPIAGGCC